MTTCSATPAWTLKRDGEVKQVELVSGRLQGKILVAKLKGLDDREVARTFAGFDICVPRALLPDLDDGEYYWHQLEGLKVIDLQGQLARAPRPPAGNRLQRCDGGQPCPGSLDDRERLLPYTEQCVQKADLAAGEMRVDWDADF